MVDEGLMDMNIEDAIIGRPFGFSVGKRKLFLYPVTLGKLYLLGRLSIELEINEDIIYTNPYLEALRLCEQKKELVCRILSYHTFDLKMDMFNEAKIRCRARLLMENLKKEELATLFVLVISTDNTESFIKHLGIDNDIETRRKVSGLRKDNGSITFGGHSPYGLLIDPICQRYGWTIEYVVWGISYVNLKMLLADTIDTVHLSGEEMKQLHIFDNKSYINADDPKNKEIIRELLND